MGYGILTFHNIPNFGALLQAYSLCEQIRSMGFDCEIIDYKCDNIVKRELTFHRSQNPLKSILLYLYIWPRSKKKIGCCIEFMNRKKEYGARSFNRLNIKDALNFYDGFISGSDMIWNLDITDHDWTYFLDFVPKNVKKISFGSSVGGKWGKEDEPNIKKLLDSYDAVSTREYDTYEHIKNTFGIECELMPDPTVFISSSQWNEMAYVPKERGYVLVYFPYTEILGAAKRYAHIHNKKVFVINNNLPIKGVKNLVLNSPESWLGYIKYADAIFTDSYHGLLFSLYFEKKVWTANHGNRIFSLLHQLEIERCFIEEDSNFENIIDYTMCERKFNQLRCDGIKFLEKYL